ncbi:hypothetical protein BC833DRAFT_644216 [Globomyces pollinis-pini]|nr:hypothetical protein BC833DRAFT_644216 [Globomyces pollinis-pini]KAJ2993660.1 hypothetical protein HDV02_002192 [Globomyces sp. JEL0801]
MGHHDEDCMCHACTCGRHKLCKPVHLTDAPIETKTEYNDHFLNYPSHVVRGKPAPQELKVGGDFYASTENREKFKLHELGPRYKIVKPEYIPNKSKLDGSTTQRENYQPWPNVTPPKRRQQAVYKPSQGTFESSTTSKRDFVEMPLPPHYIRPQQPYIKSSEKMDGVSTQVADYQRWEVTSVPTRRKTIPAPPLGNEDRDFKSTSNASYIGHPQVRELVKAPQNVTTDRTAKFYGHSTAKDAFQAWEIPPRYQRHRAKYTPTDGEFSSTTTYSNTFIPKTAVRYIHPTPTYIPNLLKFDGKSTSKSDYLAPGVINRSPDFSPRNVYMPTEDGRDFVSTTRRQHDSKPLPRCKGDDWAQMEQVKGKDGHVRVIKPKELPVDH